MTGRTLDRIFPDLPPVAADAPTALEVHDFHAEGVNGFSLRLRRGEALGIGGLAGQGQRELFMALFGARKATRGEIVVDGESRRIRRPADAIRARDRDRPRARGPQERGLAPADVGARQPDAGGAAAPRRSRGRAPRAGVLPRQSHRRRGSRSGPGRASIQEVGTLSGGNQQKALIGRWLLTEPDVMLLYDITRGVDVATKHDIYELMAELLREGKALLFYSSETEETAHLCHRVLVIREGRLAAELAGDRIDAEELVAAALREHARA